MVDSVTAVQIKEKNAKCQDREVMITRSHLLDSDMA